MTEPTYDTFITDLCQHLATHKIGQWNPTGVYKTASPPPIYLGIIPDEAQEAIAVNIYNDDRGRDDTSPDVLVQFRCKGNRHPLSAARIADQIFQLLHRESHYTLNNTTRVLSSHRHLRTGAERDTNMNWHQPDSYTFTLNPNP